jgi:ribokinase
MFMGGKGGNQAVAAARLGSKVAMVGCLGKDAYGEMYRDAFKSQGIFDEYVFVTEDTPTGVALIEVDSSGENRIIVVAGANEWLTEDCVNDSIPALTRCSLLLLQLEVPINSVMRAANITANAGGIIILDPAPFVGAPDELFTLCDYLTPNEHELGMLTDMPAESEAEAIRACEYLLSKGVKAVINKRGSHGALLVTGGAVESVRAYAVHALDTTAAGDTFNAGFAVGLSLGMAPIKALRLANAAAALSTTAMGAQNAMPVLDDALKLAGL